MTRKPLLLAVTLVLLAAAAFARGRAVSSPANADAALLTSNGANVSGVVDNVSGNLIALAGGAVLIDASGARVIGDRGHAMTVADIRPGMIVHAALRTSDVAANAPLPAVMIAVMRNADVTLFGTVQDVDRVNNTFTLLGRTFRVTPQTSFGNFFRIGDAAPGLADLQPNMLVAVQADSVNGSLVATTVTMVAPMPQPRPVHTLSGTVKSIASHEWRITDTRGNDVALAVNANTKIIGSPKVGDRVEAIYHVDSSNANVAISIIKHITVPQTVQFRATIKSIAATAWVVTRDDGTDVTLKVGSHTIRIAPAVEVGHRVEIVALKHDDGTYTLLAVIKIR